MAPDSQERNPYIGPRPFERQDKDLFFGRDREASDVLSLVIAHRVLLLYAQSGAGKTSLLNAGLIPLLEEEGFEVLRPARVQGLIPEAIETEAIPNHYVFNTLMSWAEDGADLRQIIQMSLADFLKERKHPTDEDGLPSPRVIIFDQLEELFALYGERWRDREEFFDQIRDALGRDRLLRAVLVIREDYLAQLDPYAPLLPEKLRTRYRMECLREGTALLAITGPLRDTRRRFAEGVAEKLVEDLLKVRVETETGETKEVLGEFVEPVQLQVVGQSLWQDLPYDVTVITRDHLISYGDVNQVLSGFYERSIKQATQEAGVKERDLRLWFEHDLITSAGTRGMAHIAKGTTEGIPSKAVDVLERLHLIRGEWRAGARWYELTHDRLIEPIQESNRAWGERDWGERIKKLRTVLVAWGITVVLLIIAIVGLIAISQGQLAQQRLEIAVTAQAFAEAEATAHAIAEAHRVEAVNAQATAEAERNLAEGRLRLATSRELAAAALNNLEVDPERSILLAMQAISVVHTTEAEDALHRAVQSSRVRLTLSGHTGWVRDVAFSADGTRLATASEDKTAKVWDATTGEELITLSGHTASVWGVTFSPNGTRLATASKDKTAKVWSTTTGEELFTLSGHTDWVMAVAFSPDGTRIATASKDKTVRVWDASTGGMLFALAGHADAVWDVDFSPDGTRLVTASEDKTAKVWDAATGEELITLSGHDGAVIGATFSPDCVKAPKSLAIWCGTRLATASEDKTAKVWDAATGEELITLSGHANAVWDVAFSPDGTRLATASPDRTAKVWDAATGEELITLSGHTNRVIGVAFSPLDGGRFLATASLDRTAKVWDVSAGQELLTLSGHTAAVNSVAFSPDGTHLATASSDGTVKVWDAASGQELLTLFGHIAAVNSVAFSPDGTHLATASSDGTVKVWDAATGKELLALSGHTAAVNSVAFSPGGTRLATASDDQMAKVWDISSSQKLLITLSGHIAAVNDVAFSPDGTRLATASDDQMVKVWDATTGGELLTLSGHTAAVNSVAFSPLDGGKFLATASSDGTAKVWDASSGQALLTLSGHTNSINNVIFSPDGTRLATAGRDKTTRLWNASTGEELLTLFGYTDGVRDVAFSLPDGGTRLASASEDGTVRVYVLDIEDLLRLARTRITRSLTSEECQEYLHREQCPLEP
jgi:WD40 repeat protein